MTYKSKCIIETNKDLADLVSILETSDVEANCAICTVMKSKLSVKPADLFTGTGCSTCKKCVVSIAKRKHAFLYIMDYIVKYDKKYFTVANIRKYIESQSAYAETIGYSIALIIRELVATGFIKVYNQRPNGDLYTITGKKITRSVAKTVQPLAIMKGYGFKDGIKVL